MSRGRTASAWAVSAEKNKSILHMTVAVSLTNSSARRCLQTSWPPNALSSKRAHKYVHQLFCEQIVLIEPSVSQQVMLIKNMDETLVNGTMGKVVRFVDPTAPMELEEEMMMGGKPASKGKDSKAVTSTGSRQLLPVVEFLQPGGSRRIMTVIADTWKVELPNGEVQVSRTQVRGRRSHRVVMAHWLTGVASFL